MNTKFFSLLAMLLFSMSLTFGFASCSDDDDDDNGTENTSSATQGKSAGESFIQHLEAYKAIEGEGIEVTAKKLEAGAKIYSDYQNYKKNKEDKVWKEAFLKGAAKEDAKQYEALNNFLEKDYSSPTAIVTALNDILGLLGQK